MASLKKINSRITSADNTGFSTNGVNNAGRFVNKNGKVNVIKRGVGILERNSMFHLLIDMRGLHFFFIILSFFIAVNLCFATVYFVIGIEQLQGLTPGGPIQNFAEAFFFSAQTFTTVGYGRISPTGFLTSSIAAVEALVGLLSFAVVTGLFYGRFSRPRAYIRFSELMVVSPFKNTTALMFRLAPYKNNQLVDAEVKLTMAMRLEENGVMTNKFFSLDLEISYVNALTLSWTVVHPINENSPLYGFTMEDMLNAKAEMLVYVKAFDEGFSNTVIARTSYAASEVKFGAKFRIMFQADKEGSATILYLDRINDIEPALLPG